MSETTSLSHIDDNLVIALTHSCIKCSEGIDRDHYLLVGYKHVDITPSLLISQADLGLSSNSTRPTWTHVDCFLPDLKGWNVNPDIQTCIRCKSKLSPKDIVQPVFRVNNPRAINKFDPTDVGIELGERIYFVHAGCDNPSMDQDTSNILRG